MRVYFNSRDEFYKKPFGAVKCGTDVTYKIRVTDPMKSLKVYLTLWKDSEKIADVEMDKSFDGYDMIYETTYKMPKDPCILWYHFTLVNFEEKLFYCNNDLQVGGVGKLTEYSPMSFQQTVYKNDKTPMWFKKGIAYQIFPDRFNRGLDFEKRKKAVIDKFEGKNGGKYFVDNWNKTPEYKKDEKGNVDEYEFYGGTLKGIEEKLDYLKELGVTVLYLNPIFESRANHRYDTGDYKKVDALLGTESDFESLVKKADDVGIKIILDGVFSHQGADSKYFNKFNNYDEVGAYNSKTSKYYDWYKFTNYPDEYECWWGVKDLPNVDEMNPTYLDYICRDSDSVIKHWMSKGIAGFRLDVADELPDDFIVEIRKAMDSVDKDNILIGEVWEDATNKVSYDLNRKYFLNASLKSVMNYPFMDNAVNFMKGIINTQEFSDFFYKQMENYPPEYFYSNLNMLGSHDRVRIINRLSDAPDSTTLSDEEKKNYWIERNKYLLAVARLKCLAVLLYTIPGIPMIYYGDEVGLTGYEDPYNRKAYPWGAEDKLLLEHYKMLGKLRNSAKAITSGVYRTVCCGKHTFGFERALDNEKVIVLINRGIFYDEGEHIEIQEIGTKAVDLIDKDAIVNFANNKLVVDIDPLGYKVIKIS